MDCQEYFGNNTLFSISLHPWDVNISVSFLRNLCSFQNQTKWIHAIKTKKQTKKQKLCKQNETVVILCVWNWRRELDVWLGLMLNENRSQRLGRPNRNSLENSRDLWEDHGLGRTQGRFHCVPGQGPCCWHLGYTHVTVWSEPLCFQKHKYIFPKFFNNSLASRENLISSWWTYDLQCAPSSPTISASVCKL